jgi:hypothetical protein
MALSRLVLSSSLANALANFALPDRRFPPPWSVEEQSACFVGSVKEPAVADHRSVIGHDLAS